MFTVELLGKPQRKRAHKSTRYGGYFDPDKQIKDNLSEWIQLNCPLPERPMEGPLLLELSAYFNVPKSLSKKEREKRLNGRYAYQVSIDTDNIVKLYQDILNHGLLENRIMCNDRQICVHLLRKLWTDIDERIVITIKELTDFHFLSKVL